MDDMLALAYLLSRDDVDLLGVTTVTGEPVVRARLADMMCRLAGQEISKNGSPPMKSHTTDS